MLKAKQHTSDIMLRHIGDAFRNRRLDLLISQGELAARSEVHRTYITDIESGYRNISLLTFEKLTNALNCALSFPILEAEHSMALEISRGVPLGLNFGKSLLPRDSKSFMRHLKDIAMRAALIANMTRLQLAIEKYANRKGGTYPRIKDELSAAVCGDVPVNPYTRAAELPSFGTAEDELRALKTPPAPIRAGSIEYSPVGNGANYILRGGAANGRSLAGRVPETTYILSGNLLDDNQP